MGEALSIIIPPGDDKADGQSKSSSEGALRQQRRLRALGADDLSSLTYFAFSIRALFEGTAQRIRVGGMVGTLEGLLKQRSRLQQAGFLETPAGAALLTSIGFVRCLQRDPKGALREYAAALEIRRRTGTMETPDGAFLLTAVGISKCGGGDTIGATASFNEAFRVRELTGTLDTIDGAMLWTCKGYARWAQQDLPGCIAAYEEAISLREQLGALDTVDGARLLTNLGAAQLENGQSADSLRTLKGARCVRVRIGELETFDGARLLVNIGAAEFACGNHLQVLDVNTEARWALERVDGPDSKDIAGLISNTGLAEHMLGNFSKAREAYEESMRHLKAHGAEKTPAGGRVLMSLALAHMEEGEPEVALEAFSRAQFCSKEVVEEVAWSTDLLSTVAAWREEVGDVQGALEVLNDERAIRRASSTMDTEEGRALQARIATLSERRTSLPSNPSKSVSSLDSDGDEETCASEQDRESSRRATRALSSEGHTPLASQAKVCAQPREWSEVTIGESDLSESAMEDELELLCVGEGMSITVSI